MFPTEYRRKKSVPGHYNPNSFRVLNGEDLEPFQSSHDAATQSSATNINKEYKQQQTSNTDVMMMNNNNKTNAGVRFKNEEKRFEATSLPLGDEMGRKQVRNHPHPQNTTMIADNMRYLGEPILAMEMSSRNHSNKRSAAASNGEQEHWWPSSTQVSTHEEVKRKAKYDYGTTQRSSFNTANNGTQLVMEAPSFYQQARGRHGSNPHVKPTEGILPTSDMKEEMRAPWREQGSKMREHISFDHGYDARGLEPIRGRRHGSLVCDPILKQQASNNSNQETKNELTYRTMLKQHKR